MNRPQAGTISLEDLLIETRRGRIRVPDFQRPFRWGPEDIRELLDSIYRGYPAGTLLFWKREAPAARIKFGPVEIDADQTSQALWVVDGQQRVTSLVGVLLQSTLAKDDFAFYFDLGNESFERVSKGGAPPAHWIPMNVVVDSERLLAWLDTYAGRAAHPEHLKTAMRLSRAIREYQFPTYIVESEDEQTLRVIFKRMNSSGKPLKLAEVFNALHGARTEEQPSDLHALAASLQTLGFGTIEQQWLLKAVLAVKNLDISRGSSSQLFKEDTEHTGALLNAERTLREVIVFLKRDAGIPHIQLLPYKLPLALLARFFFLHPEPSPRARDLLSRWLWRGAITGIHRGDSVDAVHRSQTAIVEDEEQSVQNLLAVIPPRPEDPLLLGAYNFRTARTKIQAIALLSLHPRDLRDGSIIEPAPLLAQDAAAAFAPLFQSSHKLFGRQANSQNKSSLLSSLANRVFHPPVEGHSLLQLFRTSPSIDKATALSHGIPIDALAYLRAGHDSGFAKMREGTLLRHLSHFLASRSRWGESDRPSIDALVVSDDGD